MAARRNNSRRERFLANQSSLCSRIVAISNSFVVMCDREANVQLICCRRSFKLGVTRLSGRRFHRPFISATGGVAVGEVVPANRGQASAIVGIALIVKPIL